MVYPKENISYKYIFTPQERENNADLMAHANAAIKELEDEKKAIASEYTAKIDAKKSELNLLGGHVMNKYTTKTTLASKRKNFVTMEWEWFDEDNNVLKREPLMGKDRQQDIPFEKPTERTKEGFDDETGEVFGSATAADINAFEQSANSDKDKSTDGVVSPDVEDLQNDQNAEQVHEAVLMLTPPPPRQLTAGEPEATEETPELPELPELPVDAVRPTAEAEEEIEKSDNEGADFDADTFNPEPETSLSKYPAKKAKATKPVATTGKKPGRPKKV